MFKTIPNKKKFGDKIPITTIVSKVNTVVFANDTDRVLLEIMAHRHNYDFEYGCLMLAQRTNESTITIQKFTPCSYEGSAASITFNPTEEQDKAHNGRLHVHPWGCNNWSGQDELLMRSHKFNMLVTDKGIRLVEMTYNSDMNTFIREEVEIVSLGTNIKEIIACRIPPPPLPTIPPTYNHSAHDCYDYFYDYDYDTIGRPLWKSHYNKKKQLPTKSPNFTNVDEVKDALRSISTVGIPALNADCYTKYDTLKDNELTFVDFIWDINPDLFEAAMLYVEQPNWDYNYLSFYNWVLDKYCIG